jgi:hypothetical protein
MNPRSDMDGAERVPAVVTAVLPSGEPVKISLVSAGSGDGMASVGLHDLDLSAALDRVGEIGLLVVDKLKAAKPGKTTVELHLGFAVEAGKLTALWVGGKGEASLTVTMEWSPSAEPASSADSAPSPGRAPSAEPQHAPRPDRVGGGS